MSEGRVPWKESNLALIGSDLDHKIKQAAAEGEPQWQGLGEEAGLKVWRIEAFRVVPWPEENYGKFHKGDSYIVLNSYKKEGSDALLHDVHIWIGSESSQDEYGTAAYKMVECDDFLGGAPIQHRETQGHESAMFQSYFSYDLVYWEGGVDSGFNHVEPTEEKPHLFRIKGNEKGLSLTQMEMKKESLNEGDSFVLVANPSKVWVWHGKSSNPDEKAKSNALGEKYCSEGTVVVLDQGDGDEEVADFWGYLGEEGEISPADELDSEVEVFAPLLFKLSTDFDVEPEQVNKGGEVTIRFGTPDPPIPRSSLEETDVYVLDAGWELFCWIGKDCDRSEKLSAISMADRYCQEDPRTVDLPMAIVKSGWEGPDFKKYFSE